MYQTAPHSALDSSRNAGRAGQTWNEVGCRGGSRGSAVSEAITDEPVQADALLGSGKRELSMQ